MTFKLKPCPFCGAAAEMTLRGNNKTKSRTVVVRCPSCRVSRTTAAVRHNVDWCVEQAAKAWNHRNEDWRRLGDEPPPYDVPVLICHAGEVQNDTYWLDVCDETGKGIWCTNATPDTFAAKADDLWMPLPTGNEHDKA